MNFYERKLKQLKKAALKVPRFVSKERKQKLLEGKAKSMDNNPTWIETAFEGILKELNIEFETQKIVGGKIYDFYIPAKNILVEADGDFWHGYDKTLAEMNHVQRKSFKNDQKKNAIAKSFGFELIRIWEHELANENIEECKKKIAGLLI